jgi:hypothetical protein
MNLFRHTLLKNITRGVRYGVDLVMLTGLNLFLLSEMVRQIETAWDLGSCDAVTMVCNKIIVCDSRTTRSGATHKGTFATHVSKFHMLTTKSF